MRRSGRTSCHRCGRRALAWINVVREPVARCVSRYAYEAFVAKRLPPVSLDACVASGRCRFAAFNASRDERHSYGYGEADADGADSDAADAATDAAPRARAPREFADAGAWRAQYSAGVLDGLRVDAKGNVWASGPGGVHVFAADGAHLGLVELADEADGGAVPLVVTDLAFGSDGHLYIATETLVARVAVKVKGAHA